MIQPSDVSSSSSGYLSSSVSDCLDPVSWTEKKAVHVDWRSLNAAIIAPKTAPGRVQNWPRFQKEGVISRIDLRCGHLRLRIHKDDRKHTAFNTLHGCFEWLVVPHGIAGAAAGL